MLGERFAIKFHLNIRSGVGCCGSVPYDPSLGWDVRAKWSKQRGKSSMQDLTISWTGFPPEAQIQDVSSKAHVGSMYSNHKEGSYYRNHKM